MEITCHNFYFLKMFLLLLLLFLFHMTIANNQLFDGQYQIYSTRWTSTLRPDEQAFPYNNNWICIVRRDSRGIHVRMERVGSFYGTPFRLVRPSTTKNITSIDACFQSNDDSSSCLIYRRRDVDDTIVVFLRGQQERQLRMEKPYKRLLYDHIGRQFYVQQFDGQIFMWQNVSHLCASTANMTIYPMIKVWPPPSNNNLIDVMMEQWEDLFIADGKLYYIRAGAIYRQFINASNNNPPTFVSRINAHKFSFFLFPTREEKAQKLAISSQQHAFWMTMFVSIESVVVLALIICLAHLKRRQQKKKGRHGYNDDDGNNLMYEAIKLANMQKESPSTKGI